MPQPYSQDFREKVIEVHEEGLSVEKTAKQFRIAVSTIKCWKRLKKETGTVEPRKAIQKGIPRKFSLLELENYVNEHPDQTQYEMADALGVSQVLICLRLKELNYSRKKRLFTSRKGTRRKGKNGKIQSKT